MVDTSDEIELVAKVYEFLRDGKTDFGLDNCIKLTCSVFNYRMLGKCNLGQTVNVPKIVFFFDRASQSDLQV